MGAGDKFDADSMLPVPAGSYVIHYGNTIHDGAKNEAVVIQVRGMGPAALAQVEKRSRDGWAAYGKIHPSITGLDWTTTRRSDIHAKLG